MTPPLTAALPRAQTFVRGLRFTGNHLIGFQNPPIGEVLSFERIIPRHLEVFTTDLSREELLEIQRTLNSAPTAPGKLWIGGFSITKYQVGADPEAGTLFFSSIEFRPPKGCFNLFEPSISGFRKVTILPDSPGLVLFTTTYNDRLDLPITGETTWLSTAPDEGRRFCSDLLCRARNKPPAAVTGDPENLKRLAGLFQM